MTLNPLPLADAADRRSGPLATWVRFVGVAALALSAFAFAGMLTSEAPGTALRMGVPAVPPFVVLPTVPQAADVLPAAPSPKEPPIATHGG